MKEWVDLSEFLEPDWLSEPSNPLRALNRDDGSIHIFGTVHYVGGEPPEGRKVLTLPPGMRPVYRLGHARIRVSGDEVELVSAGFDFEADGAVVFRDKPTW